MKIVLKGRGKSQEVMKEIMEVVGNQDVNGRANVSKDDMLDYVVNYLQGSISIEELTYTIRGWFLDDNLKVTELVALIQENEDKWREEVKDPAVWFQSYVKELDPVSKKVILIRRATYSEIPTNAYEEDGDADNTTDSVI